MNNPIPPKPPGSGQNKKYRNRRRGPRNPNAPGGQQQAGANPQQGSQSNNPQGGGSRPHNNNNQNRNRPPQQRNHQPQNRNQNAPSNESLFNQVKNLATSRVGDFYDELLNQHAKARKLYFEYYYRADRNKITKLENQFFESMRKIREFLKLLKPWQREELDKKINFYPNDTIFSSGNSEEEKKWLEQLDQLRDEPPTAPTEYHISPIQKQRPSYKDDAEESYGEMEDYIQYRAQNPQK